MKASVSYKTLDNITVVMLAFKNFKKALSDEFCQVNNIVSESQGKQQPFKFIVSNHYNIDQSKESGAVNSSGNIASDE
jgi:hypothetical protein